MSGTLRGQGRRLAILLLAALAAIAAGIAIRRSSRDSAPRPRSSRAHATAPAEVQPGLLYGRVTTVDGAVFEGRLRWGKDEEAFWGDYFNGTTSGNRWAAQVGAGRVPTVREPIEIFGMVIGYRRRPVDLRRPFMARFGDLARIEARSRRDVRVTLKSGTVFDLDRFAAGDLDDGVRAWDRTRGLVDVDTARIRTVEFLPAPARAAPVDRLHGTVRTRQGTFTGFVQWDRQECLGSDILDGRHEGRRIGLRFDTIRAIAKHSPDSSVVTLRDGRALVLDATVDSESREVGRGNHGIYVDDRRYGRVLVSWDAFERVDFTPAGTGPAYGTFLPGGPLAGSVLTRNGQRHAGRLVFDLDEGETTETLDAPSHGIDYTIPFGLVASIALESQGATVTLRSGEELSLERSGDLGDRNAGMLVFAEDKREPRYVAWRDVKRIELNQAYHRGK